MKCKYDYLIVGSGLFGSVFAYLAGEDGKKCLVVDKRKTVGGNLYCENIEGINVHKYGSHIFHTSDKEVWDFISGLVPFNHYVHNTMANYKDKVFNLPFNMNTFNELWGATTPDKVKQIIDTQKFNGEVTNLEEQALSLVGKDIFETLIKGYTEKQWGRKCSELPSYIIKRLPVRFTYDNNYFNDIYQGIPIGGYNKLFDRLLYKADTVLGNDFNTNKEYLLPQAKKIVYTGKIDEYFDYCFGPLEYRSVSFKEEVLNTPNYQGCAVMNYTDKEVPWTRIIEHKHFEYFNDDVFKVDKTIISKEFSQEWSKGMEGYYPINDEKNNEIYGQYEALAQKEKNVIFGGRLAEYKYYDMDDTIRCAMDAYRNSSF